MSLIRTTKQYIVAGIAGLVLSALPVHGWSKHTVGTSINPAGGI
jgi:hypothetical protein